MLLLDKKESERYDSRIILFTIPKSGISITRFAFGSDLGYVDCHLLCPFSDYEF